ncbi:MAG: hypothetical protein Q7R96_05270 [Nanoarchaeota archaeon]|nr:hypothetical protein [Nanoarchaeota archaeon]
MSFKSVYEQVAAKVQNTAVQSAIKYGGIVGLALSAMSCTSPMQMSVIGSNRMYGHEPQDINIVFKAEHPALVYGTTDVQVAPIGSPIVITRPGLVIQQKYNVPGTVSGSKYGPIRTGIPEAMQNGNPVVPADQPKGKIRMGTIEDIVHDDGQGGVVKLVDTPKDGKYIEIIKTDEDEKKEVRIPIK